MCRNFLECNKKIADVLLHSTDTARLEKMEIGVQNFDRIVPATT